VAEYDHIVSGGDPTVVPNDANQFAGIATTPAPITSSGPAPVAVGVIADQPAVETNAGAVTPVVFDVYLTGTASTATTIDYVVTAGGAGFLGASAFGGTLPAGSVVVQDPSDATGLAGAAAIPIYLGNNGALGGESHSPGLFATGLFHAVLDQHM
jgi:hypothetical protein